MISSRAYRLAVPLALVALLVGCARPVSSSSEAPAFPGDPVPSGSGRAVPSAPVVTCPPDGIRFQVGSGDAAMGIRVLSITLVNCGPQSYRLNGYPAVRSLDDDRTALKVRVLHGVKEIIGTGMPWDQPPRPVVLEPGQQAGTAVAWRNTYDDIREPPVTVKFLDIAPLVGRPSQIVVPDGGLDLGSTGRLGVSAWTLIPDSSATVSPDGRAVPDASAPPPPSESVGPLL
ncbi:DUF4232 domain-containing protein [Actinoplanes auranticolor]|uniref:DUF4232 domain-containing protein n=1 Tax=Actinoplanes auranticolor TaxID=47988 RepID=A0A919S5H9_9ACTN|nr:DUF4232 domain-containing protein [Actinoplanes auranticolor]GIM65131.1 hypothetical protein Aau02nite_14960 [Actinoplanes auranticolor]